MLKLFNSLSKQKETFETIEPKKVRMYVCGMTVYDYCHVGHARVMVVFDMVSRYLRSRGYQVKYVRNITDIDDKIIKRAHENGESIQTLTERFIAAMHEDTAALGVLPADVEPKATESIPAIIAMIEQLIARDFAYVADNGDVYYHVAKFADYGKLSGKKIDELRSGERVEINTSKHDPLDFVLWKIAKSGEPSWSSPWGDGRPGWHIECSAMSTEALGHHFDIHGGGFDLQFPHHENEIAQSEGCHGGTYVRYWMHNGFVNINDEKMSKSLGNFFTLRDVLQLYRAEDIRYFILSSHYRSPLSYSEDNLLQAKQNLARWYTALRGLELLPEAGCAADFDQRFVAAMDDDFNTPEAFAVIFDLVHRVNRLRADGDAAQAGALGSALKRLAGVLGLLESDPESHLQSGNANEISAAAIEDLIAQRLAARKEKNWAEADRIRDVLKAQGVAIEDNAQLTSWRRV